MGSYRLAVFYSLFLFPGLLFQCPPITSKQAKHSFGTQNTDAQDTDTHTHTREGSLLQQPAQTTTQPHIPIPVQLWAHNGNDKRRREDEGLVGEDYLGVKQKPLVLYSTPLHFQTRLSIVLCSVPNPPFDFICTHKALPYFSTVAVLPSIRPPAPQAPPSPPTKPFLLSMESIEEYGCEDARMGVRCDITIDPRAKRDQMEIAHKHRHRHNHIHTPHTSLFLSHPIWDCIGTLFFALLRLHMWLSL